MLWGLRDLSSPIRNWTQALESESMEYLALDHQGILPPLFKNKNKPTYIYHDVLIAVIISL